MKNNPEQRKARGTTQTQKSKSQTEGNKKTKEDKIGSMSVPHHKAQLVIAQEDLRERFLFIVETWAADKYRYEWLENHTGIPAARWQNVLLEKQLPTLEMLLSVCKERPNYTYWLMHGTRQQWLSADSEKYPWKKLDCPSEEMLLKFKTDREWIKQRRKSNTPN